MVGLVGLEGLGQLAGKGLGVSGDWTHHVLVRKQSLARRKARLSFYSCLGSHISSSLGPMSRGFHNFPRQCRVLGTDCINT